MDEKRSRRLAVVWTAFAVAMGAFVLLDGLAATLQDALGVLLVAAGLGLAALYWYRPDLLTIQARTD